jgi:SAM-dependent methyltransferase
MTDSPNSANLGIMDVVDLQNFYASPLGKATHRLVAAKLKLMLPAKPEGRVLGLGFATPYLSADDDGVLAFMLARRGVLHWPAAGPIHSALVDEYDLPLPDNSIELAVVVHGLEFTDEPSDMLTEIWRVLAPQGQLMLIVPNRVGLWSLSDQSPFGFGQPFSKQQLQRHLVEAQFSVSKMEGALFMPPWGKGAALHLSTGLEKFGAAALGQFSGVLVAQATKQVYAYAKGRKRLSQPLRLKPALLGRPQPSHRMK